MCFCSAAALPQRYSGCLGAGFFPTSRCNTSRTLLNITTYAVGDPAFGKAVLFLLLYFVFALYERKNEIQINRKYHAAAG
jgi:hypothetical protein